jgi:citrate lyase beta subunit
VDTAPASGAANEGSGVSSKTLRSLLFVPADDERKIERALGSAADAVILDLEDAVSPARKAAARTTAAEVLASRPDRPQLFVRINTPLSEAGAADIALLRGSAELRVIVPKCELTSLAACDIDAELVALVETARGVTELGPIAAHARVTALQLGAEDLGAELGWTPREDSLHLLYVRSRIVLESAVAGLVPPIDAITKTWRDRDVVRAEALMGRSLGFGAKACIHPDQVEPVNRAFTPTDAELRWARSVLDAHDRAASSGIGVSTASEQMVDAAVVRRAHRVLATSPLCPTEG